MDDDRLALVAKALAHPARVRIVRLLAEQTACRGVDLFAGLPLAQSTISQHLLMLKQAGIVTSHAAGQGSVYCLNPEALQTFCAELTPMTVSTPTCSPETKECR